MLAVLFDFPWADRRKLTEWSDWAGDIEIVKDPAKRDQRLEKLFEMGGYFKKLWDERVDKAPTPDLISMMIHSEAMKDMSMGEFMGNLVLLIVGGNDTTRNTMSGLAYSLNKFPDQRAMLEADPSLIPNAVSEIIRWQTPLAHMRRTALSDTELEGHKIKAGQKIIMWYISANRDESIFPDADKLDIKRDNARRQPGVAFELNDAVREKIKAMSPEERREYVKKLVLEEKQEK